MKTSYLLIVLLICSMELAACGTTTESVSVDQPSLQPISSSEPSKPAAPPAETRPVEQFVTGQLAEIDLDAKTFVLKDVSGNAQSFEFSESTKLTGGRGARDLRGQAGHDATVRYVELDNRKSAVQIHIELGS